MKNPILGPTSILFYRMIATNMPTQVNLVSPLLRGLGGDSNKNLTVTLLKVIHVDDRLSWVKLHPGIILLA